MTVMRFAYQRECILDELGYSMKPILNIGCNDDGYNLKGLSPRVVNCDLFERDEIMNRPNAVDVLFDCAVDVWPFEDDSVALVIFGDILEHLMPSEIEFALMEARRVSERLCITVPTDDRETTTPEHAAQAPRGAAHQTIVTRGLLLNRLIRAGWHVTDWRDVPYDDGVIWGKPVDGFFVRAERAV